MDNPNSFGAAATLCVAGTDYQIYRLATLEENGIANISRLPFSTKILLENLLRMEDGIKVRKTDIEYVARGVESDAQEISFMPARVLLQDFTGVPCVVDLAAMRDALAAMGKEPSKANPLLPADLVIDHSVQVDSFGSKDSFSINALLENQRNRERYILLRWGQTAFENFRVVPPDTGIVHQVNLEYLAPVVFKKKTAEGWQAYPDTLVGTDSHTTMINGLGVVGWGVGGIEAEACMLGQPVSMLLPPVVGFKLHGKLKEGCTATDLVLTVTQMLRKRGVVGKFVEFYGAGLSALSLADRATVANMAPEYGATIGFFPVDDETLNYLRVSNRDPEHIALVEAYCKEQGLFRVDDMKDPIFGVTLELDLATVVPSMAGPKRPQDRVELPNVKANFKESFKESKSAAFEMHGEALQLKSGAVAIAAITSCTNTSNPSVMVAAGILAKKAAQRGLKSQPWVKTSLAPGSKVVSDYLNAAGLMPYMEALNFHLVGYGCTTCIGNSGPLIDEVGTAVQKENIVVAAVLSGNRNFEGRVNPLVKANYLASPPLVVAYALAGTVDIDIQNEPLGKDNDGNNVFLREIWPTTEEVQNTIRATINPEMFRESYSKAFEGDETWKAMQIPTGKTYIWDDSSTYIKKPPYFDKMPIEAPAAIADQLCGLRVLAVLGDSVTTDHISPAGSIALKSPAGQYLVAQGVQPSDFNSYGARRGNHEVMVRGTLANIRLRNQLVPGVEGPFTTHMPDGEQMFIYDAAMKYAQEGVGLVILAGKEYGSGSSRDWAAKGVKLLGVRAVIAESFERIHRTNLVGMGVLPLQFQAEENAQTLKLTGKEMFHVEEIRKALSGNHIAKVAAVNAEGVTKEFEVLVRIDTPQEAEYFRHGGILQYVLRQIAAEA
ncbi:MAG: aconitate hydratase [Bryobacterales bacterium]|nr:aconitate hydratase [Bryobacterales bacterium]